LQPEEKWETGESPFLGLTPNVIFIEAMKKIDENKFLVFYGAADSVIGSAIIEVKIENENGYKIQSK